MDRRGLRRPRWAALALGLAAAFGGLTVAPQASAALSGEGHQDGTFTGAGDAPTADKPQSKLWFNDGLWWADMFDTKSGTWHIFKLNRANQTWSDTGTRIDDRPSSRGDALWDGTHLYVATNVVAASSAANVTNQPARLYRYSYSAAAKKYALDAGFPASINNVSSESLTLDKDSKGTLWATWTQAQKVYVNSTSGTDTSWGTPFAVADPGGSGISADDISSVAAYGNSKIGLMWSNQATSTFYVSVHKDGDPRTSWTTTSALSSPGIADDHISLKQVVGDGAGHLYAAVKTSLDTTKVTSATQIYLLALNLSDGNWETTEAATVGDCLSRPVLAIDTTNRVLHMFMSGPSGSGCPGPGTPGTIYDKTSPLDSPSFESGRGTAVIADPSSPDMNDITGTKQTITSLTGLVVLASSNASQRYWHADIPVPGPKPAPPVTPVLRVGFAVATVKGKKPMTVRFSGVATGLPVTRWTWKFGDGRSGTGQKPVHTYKKAGVYTVTAVGTTANGKHASVNRKIKITRPRASR
jgi:hypothetical protein